MASETSGRVLTFTIYETRLFKIALGEKTMMLEGWIVDDALFDSTLFVKRGESLARLLTAETIRELDLKDAIKHPEAQGVAIVRKSVADFGTDYDLVNLMTHEAGHLLLGHDGSAYEREEREVAEVSGKEIEEELNLFGIRYIATRQERPLMLTTGARIHSLQLDSPLIDTTNGSTTT